jgi:hypothetical protein
MTRLSELGIATSTVRIARLDDTRRAYLRL